VLPTSEAISEFWSLGEGISGILRSGDLTGDGRRYVQINYDLNGAPHDSSEVSSNDKPNNAYSQKRFFYPVKHKTHGMFGVVWLDYETSTSFFFTKFSYSKVPPPRKGVLEKKFSDPRALPLGGGFWEFFLICAPLFVFFTKTPLGQAGTFAISRWIFPKDFCFVFHFCGATFSFYIFLSLSLGNFIQGGYRTSLLLSRPFITVFGKFIKGALRVPFDQRLWKICKGRPSGAHVDPRALPSGRGSAPFLGSGALLY
jgi:hypothetical protein